jgi:dienelactone hydrolase
VSYFYNYQQMADLINNGGHVDRDGDYNLWLWCAKGTQTRVEAAGQKLLLSCSGAAGRFFSWQRLAAVKLKKNRRFRLSIDSGSDVLPGDRPPLAGMALSVDKGFDPGRSFALGRVFNSEPAPLRDERLTEIKHLDLPWTLQTYPTREAWEHRAAFIRQHILVSTGLWPLPEKTPMKPRIFGRIERQGYSVEKVFFESRPGFLVCGNLYSPLGKGPFPGIASPHGHWGQGRLENSELGSIPGRCINLARQGHVAFSYDMVGYQDSDQIAHRRFGGAREDLWGLGAMGLQLWNSIRVVDFLCSLEKVDSKRIGCTGASGGATQTFLLGAVDERVRAAAMINMVSAHMQGGCICENQGHLRLDINNVEIASAMAPRPLLLVAATGDWTIDTPELEYPAVEQIYRLYGAADRVEVKQFDAPHNYHKGSREAAYDFFGRWFLGGRAGAFKEQPFEVEAREDLLVFHRRQKPAHILDSAGLVEAVSADSAAQLRALRPKDARGLGRFRNVMGPALAHALGATRPAPEDLYVRDMGRMRQQDFLLERLLLGRAAQGERVPALLFSPRSGGKKTPATLVVHPEGKEALVDCRYGRPGPVVADLLALGHKVLAIDPFLSGEARPNFGGRDREVGHFSTYNQEDAACRVQDILTGLAYLETREDVGRRHLLGLAAAGPWCLLARALDRGVGRTVVDFNRFDVDDDERWAADLFIPGIRSVGDVRTALALIAPAALLVHNTGANFPRDWARGAYRASAKKERLQLVTPQLKWGEISAWLSAK